MKNRCPLLLLLTCLCISCINVRDRSKEQVTQSCEVVDSLYIIDLQEPFRSEQGSVVNTLARDVRYTALEFQREAALSTLNLRVDKLGDKLIVSSYNSPVLQFDSLGGYEKRVIEFGRERAELRRSLYKSKFSNGELVFNQGNKCIVLSNDSKRGFISDQYYYSVVSLLDGSYVALPNFGDQIMDNQLHLDFLNKEFCYVESVQYAQHQDIYYQIPKGDTGRLEVCILSPAKSGGALYRTVFSDTVYLVSSAQKIEPYIQLQYGKLMPEVREVTDQNKIHVSNIDENDNYIFIKYGYQSSVYTQIWDKRKKSTVVSSKIDYDDNNTLINYTYFADFLSPHGEIIKVGIAGISDDILYCSPRGEDAVKLVDKITIEDNPLILEIVLK